MPVVSAQIICVARRQVTPRADAVLTVYMCDHNHRFLLVGPHMVFRWSDGANLLVQDHYGSDRWLVHGCECGSPMKREAKLSTRVPIDAVLAAFTVGGVKAVRNMVAGHIPLTLATSGRGVYLDHP